MLEVIQNEFFMLKSFNNNNAVTNIILSNDSSMNNSCWAYISWEVNELDDLLDRQDNGKEVEEVGLYELNLLDKARIFIHRYIGRGHIWEIHPIHRRDFVCTTSSNMTMDDVCGLLDWLMVLYLLFVVCLFVCWILFSVD